ncbi:acidic mammalian chitinase-like [Epinephelus fuscoguttatus]|uniref:acidic mammalian chitinase-like n=1 Tax=Epinephelus fuscoguttatus TaxID=293821 RepID=UPI0020D0940A|nr:acidic mammalian chitinase-like [Epinephelus fuscoguttatus]
MIFLPTSASPSASTPASTPASLSASPSASSHRLVCYYNSLSEKRGKFTVSNIDPNKCTNLIYAFSDIKKQPRLVPSTATDILRYQAFSGLKTRNPLLKTLLAVGGLNFNTQKFSAMVATQQNRAKFIRSAITLLRANGFDTELCFCVVQELKEAFMAEGTADNRLLITASVSAEKAIIDASYEVPQIATYLDFINALTFDFHGPWESVTGHHSPLYQGSQDTGNKTYFNTDYAINMGLAAYRRVFNLSSASSVVGAPASGAGIAGLFTGEEGLWASYEADQKSNTSYLKANNFGGAFVWSLDLDDTSGQFCKQGNNPFISHLHTLLCPGGTSGS